MQSRTLSRRQLAQLAGAAVASGGRYCLPARRSDGSSGRRAYQKNIGSLANADGRYLQGRRPGHAVTGIATSFMATLDVLQRAAAAGRTSSSATNRPSIATWMRPRIWPPTRSFAPSWISSRRTSSWSGASMITGTRASRTPSTSRWRSSWLGEVRRGQRPDAVCLPPRRLAPWLATCKSAQTQALRVVGIPAEVSKVALSRARRDPHADGIDAQGDVYVCGEATEWEASSTPGYDRRWREKGDDSGGHQVTEEPGMNSVRNGSERWSRHPSRLDSRRDRFGCRSNRAAYGAAGREQQKARTEQREAPWFGCRSHSVTVNSVIAA